jgi:hypothetical protein
LLDRLNVHRVKELDYESLSHSIDKKLSTDKIY